jgi:hypothetical protein
MYQQSGSMVLVIRTAPNRSVPCQYIHSTHSLPQGELEHRSPKARYKRTDRRAFVKQLTQIERRQVRIRRIGDKLTHRPQTEITELATNPHVHHHIGMTQKYPVHIGSYLRSHKGDPAIKVSSFSIPQTPTHFCRISCQNLRSIYCVVSTSQEISQNLIIPTLLSSKTTECTTITSLG